MYPKITRLELKKEVHSHITKAATEQKSLANHAIDRADQMVFVNYPELSFIFYLFTLRDVLRAGMAAYNKTFSKSIDDLFDNELIDNCMHLADGFKERADDS